MTKYNVMKKCGCFYLENNLLVNLDDVLYDTISIVILSAF